jgi:hypothetical protein
MLKDPHIKFPRNRIERHHGSLLGLQLRDQHLQHVVRLGLLILAVVLLISRRLDRARDIHKHTNPNNHMKWNRHNCEQCECACKLVLGQVHVTWVCRLTVLISCVSQPVRVNCGTIYWIASWSLCNTRTQSTTIVVVHIKQNTMNQSHQNQLDDKYQQERYYSYWLQGTVVEH